MILDELVLHNFGVYRGRQTFNLAPEPGRPIILIGAQNGAGKTTFLEGLQLAFFGRLVAASFRGASSYEDYLRRSINRGVAPQEGAEVQVTFRRAAGGTEQVYTIRRAWSVHKSGVREVFEAVVDGKLDRVLTAQWAEFVEDMLPPRIAPLFFFDGERIEQFADLDRSSEIIGTAVSALLGLDIVDRLQVDLEVLQRRKTAEAGNAAARAELAASEAEVEAATEALRAAHVKVGAATQRRDRGKAVLEKARAKLQAEGGGLFAARESLVAERGRLEAALEVARRDLRDWAGGSAPLLLVQDLLQEVATEAEREVASEASRTILAHLNHRDQRTLAELKMLGADEALMVRAQSFFEADRARLADSAAAEGHLGLSGLARAGLEGLLQEGLPQSRSQQGALLERLEALEAQRDDLERRIASIPAEETVAPLLRAVADAEAALAQAESELVVYLRDHEAAERELASSRRALQSKLEREVQERLVQEDAERIVAHARRVRDTVGQFRAEVIRHHVHRIERLIVEGLRELLRKPDLVVDVQIDPQTFGIVLRGGGWDALSPDQLSAGERQLFAVALLWALAKAAGQAAPTVIDTPLGRLDSQHRARLVERYFPHAGEQVILLSTDEEIDDRLYGRLEPWLSRSYTLVYHPEGRGTHVEPGYAFSEPTEREAA